MKKKFVWLTLSCLMVAAFMLASCAPAAPTTPTTPTTPTKPTTPTTPTTPAAPTTPAGPTKEMVKDSLGRPVEKPKYGGVFVNAMDLDVAGFDDHFFSHGNSYTLHNTNETVSEGDWIKGPSGTGEFKFSDGGFIGQKGAVAESWELPDPDTVILHIRKGVYWHNKPPVNGRELTASDVAFSLQRDFEAGSAGYMNRNYRGWLKSVETPDKYTAIFRGKDTPEVRTANMFESLVTKVAIVAPEAVKQFGDMKDWKILLALAHSC